jgi:hypothetical protein
MASTTHASPDRSTAAMPHNSMSADSTPNFASRPRTANPKLVHLSFDLQQHHSNCRPDEQPSPLVSGRGQVVGEGSVLWSQDETLSHEQLIRPHTSNPRYVERYHNDTPRRESPSRQSSETTSAVLWASDANDLNPSLLARPLTSNPWLARFLDGVPDAKIGPAGIAGANGAEILWSAKEIEDWRMLARPHASNPTYEHASATATAGSSPPGMRGVSEVLWTSDEPTTGPAPSTGGDMVTAVTIAELKYTIDSQRARIRDLEDEVMILRKQLSHLSLAAAAAATSTGSAKHHGRPYVAAPPAATTVTPQPVATPQPVVPPISTAEERRSAPPQSLSKPSRAEIPPQPQQGVVEVPTDVPAAAATPSKHVRIDSSPVEIIRDDVSDDHDADKLFHRIATKQVNEDDDVGSRGFVSRVRSQTGQRPDTAAAQRPSLPSAPPRPQSAPVTRPAQPHRPAAGVWNVPPSFGSIASERVVSDNTIDAAYDALKEPGEELITKDAFRRLYMAKAEQYGIVPSASTLARLLQPYNSKGRHVLTRQEFAVLFLQFQRW